MSLTSEQPDLAEVVNNFRRVPASRLSPEHDGR